MGFTSNAISSDTNANVDSIEVIKDTDIQNELSAETREGMKINRKEKPALMVDKQITSEEHHIDIEPNKTTHQLVKDELHVPGEPLKLLAAIIFLFVGLGTSVLSLSLTHDRVPNDKALPDIFLSNVPYQHWAFKTAEYIILVLSFTAGMVVLFHK